MNDSAQIIQLLSEIKTSLLESDNVTLLVAFVGMVGVVVGTLFTGLFQMISSRIAAKNEQEKLLTQIKTEVITKQRQEWMDSVRNAAKDLLAEYDSSTITYLILKLLRKKLPGSFSVPWRRLISLS